MVFNVGLSLGACSVGLSRCKTIVCNDIRAQRAMTDNWLLVRVFPANLVPPAI